SDQSPCPQPRATGRLPEPPDLKNGVSPATLVVQGSCPRSWRYTIADGQLLVESLHPHGPVTTYQLDSFRSFSLTADSTRGDTAVHSTILLIPTRRFSPAFELFLSGTAATDYKIIERLEDLLPEGQGTAYLDIDTLIHKVAKKLRIE
ncbi:hypothetical protein, partial [Propionibacterium freudenreichii]|uniref:hypothetical protein n=2 Tax=Propionibacterium freudenreichii TaxID=1744 RepID=UPI0021A2F3FF